MSVQDYLQSFAAPNLETVLPDAPIKEPSPPAEPEPKLAITEATPEPPTESEAIYKQIEQLTKQITDLSFPVTETESIMSRTESPTSFRSDSPEEGNFESIVDPIKARSASIDPELISNMSDSDLSQYSDVIDIQSDLEDELENVLEPTVPKTEELAPASSHDSVPTSSQEPEKVPKQTKSIFQIIQEGTEKLGAFFKQDKNDSSLSLLRKTLDELKEAADSLQPKIDDSFLNSPLQSPSSHSLLSSGSSERDFTDAVSESDYVELRMESSSRSFLEKSISEETQEEDEQVVRGELRIGNLPVLEKEVTRKSQENVDNVSVGKSEPTKAFEDVTRNTVISKEPKVETVPIVPPRKKHTEAVSNTKECTKTPASEPPATSGFSGTPKSIPEIVPEAPMSIAGLESNHFKANNVTSNIHEAVVEPASVPEDVPAMQTLSKVVHEAPHVVTLEAHTATQDVVSKTAPVSNAPLDVSSATITVPIAPSAVPTMSLAVPVAPLAVPEGLSPISNTVPPLPITVPEEAIAEFNATALSMEQTQEPVSENQGGFELQSPDTVEYLVQSPPKREEENLPEPRTESERLPVLPSTPVISAAAETPEVKERIEFQVRFFSGAY